jgi:tRNA modification GTPase
MIHKAGDEETICAVSTPPGVGGIAVIRVSGPSAANVGRKFCSFLPEKLESHRIYYGIFKSVLAKEDLDEVLVSYFQEGRSFTGEETLEISCHGGTALTALILKELISGGARLAKPGEFTYRAFMNGRLDLVQAESVLSLIESQSRQSAKVALRQLQGHLSSEFARIENDLLWILAQLEASIDFSAEGIEIIPSQVLSGRAGELQTFLAKLIDSYHQGRLLREGLQIALVGRPNVGKSSLLNALLKEDKAIVTEHAGTTRDLIEGTVAISGVPVTFVDTAGLRETENAVEKIGIARSRQAMERADLIFYVLDLAHSDFERELGEYSNPLDARARFVFNKTDLDGAGAKRSEASARLAALGAQGRAFWISAAEGTGLSDIEATLSEMVGQMSSDSGSIVTQARHLELLQKIQSCLQTAIGLINKDSSPEFIAFELQEAIRAIHELLGKEFHEQVIDRIFKEFCLGK